MLVLLHNWVQGFQRSIIFFLYKKKTPAHYSHNVSHRLLIKQKAHTLPWDSVQCTVSRLAFMDMKVPLILANCFCGLCTYLLDSLWAPGPLYPLCTCMWGSLVLHAGGVSLPSADWCPWRPAKDSSVFLLYQRALSEPEKPGHGASSLDRALFLSHFVCEDSEWLQGPGKLPHRSIAEEWVPCWWE